MVAPLPACCRRGPADDAPVVERRSSRWVSLLAAMALSMCGGSIYITGLYTSDLKHRFFPGTDGQLKVEQLVFACNFGNWLPAAGFFNDSRFGGGRNTAWVAAVLTLLGYLGVWAWSAGLTEFSYWQVLIFWFLWGHGSGWFDNAAVSATAKNFPQQRGRSVALVKAFYGLSGSVLTQAYNLFFYNRTTPFLLFLGIALSVAGTLIAPSLRFVAKVWHGERDQPIKRLSRGLAAVVGLAVVLLLGCILRVSLSASMSLDLTLFLTTILCLGLLSWVLVSGGGVVSLAASPTILDVQTPASRHAAGPLAVNLTAKEALCSASYWLLFFVCFVGSGSGLVILNHIGQMVSALGGSQSQTTVLISLLCVVNCFGRVTFGVVPDALDGRVGRAWFLVLNTAVSALGHLVISMGNLNLLFVGTLVATFSYGGYWTLMPTLVIEFCGLHAFATIYSTISLAVSLASLVFSTVLASALYDRAAEAQGGSSGNCTGPSCYRQTCFVVAASLALAFLASGALAMLARRPRRPTYRDNEVARRILHPGGL